MTEMSDNGYRSGAALASSVSCLDGVPFKIGESFKCPRKVMIPPSCCVSKNSCKALEEEYAFSTEEAVLKWMDDLKETEKVRQHEDNERRKTQDEIQNGTSAGVDKQTSEHADAADGSLTYLKAPFDGDASQNNDRPEQAAVLTTTAVNWTNPVFANLGTSLLTPVQISNNVPSNHTAEHREAIDCTGGAAGSIDYKIFEKEDDLFDDLELQTINEKEELKNVLTGFPALNTTDQNKALCTNDTTNSTSEVGATAKPSAEYVNIDSLTNMPGCAVNSEVAVRGGAVASGSDDLLQCNSVIASQSQVLATNTSSNYQALQNLPKLRDNQGESVSYLRNNALPPIGSPSPPLRQPQMNSNINNHSDPVYDNNVQTTFPDNNNHEYENVLPIAANFNGIFEHPPPPANSAQLPRWRSENTSQTFRPAVPPRPRPTPYSRHSVADVNLESNHIPSNFSNPFLNPENKSGYVNGIAAQAGVLREAKSNPDFFQSLNKRESPVFRKSPPPRPSSNQSSIDVDDVSDIEPDSATIVKTDTVSFHSSMTPPPSQKCVVFDTERGVASIVKTDTVMYQRSSSPGHSQTWNPYNPLPPAPKRPSPRPADRERRRSEPEAKSVCLNGDPYVSLSEEAKAFVDRLLVMGFKRPRVARAVQRLGQNDKLVVEHLLLVNSLIEQGYKETQSENALGLFKNNVDKTKQYLNLYSRFEELGFSSDKINDALIRSDNNSDRALDLLTT